MFAPLAAAVLAVSAPAPPPVAAPPELLVSLATASRPGQRTLPLNGTVTVVVTNTTAKPLAIWRDWCSWGYFNVSLEFRDESTPGSPRTWIITKAEKEWCKNYPDAAELAPGESMLFPLELTAGVWEGFDQLARFDGKKLKMRAKYHIPPEDGGPQIRLWTGTANSAWQEFVVGKK